MCSISRRQLFKFAGGIGAVPLLAQADDHLHHHSLPVASSYTDLSIGYQTVKITHKNTRATTVNQLLPGPLLRWKEGARACISVTNNLKETTSIHWHGIILPSNMDGVPGLSFDGIAPGQTFKYEFDVQQSGTYWYHSHSGHQEQTGLLGAIIIEPREPEPFHYDRDLVLILSDWTDEAPARIYEKLKKHSDYYNYRQPTLRDKKPLDPMWNQMRMSPTDIADVTGATYTYLLNGQSNRMPWQALFKPGETLRLRLINGSAMTFFDVRIPGVKLRIVAADGQYVQPVEVDELRIGIAEVYDLLITLPDEKPVCFFAQSMDRSGYVLGQITPKADWFAEVPVMDEAPVLSHEDMGMNMNAGGDHSAHQSHSQAEAAPATQQSEHSTESHADHQASAPSAGGNSPQYTTHTNHQAHDVTSVNHTAEKTSASESRPADHGQMDHSQMDHANMDHSTMNHSGMNHASMDHSSMNHSMMDHEGHSMTVTEAEPTSNFAKAGFGVNFDAATPVKHKATEAGPHIDMLAMSPASGLADPGVGLRHHQHRLGRKVFTYADLRSYYPTKDKRQPTREIEIHLTGNMHRYLWSLDGLTYHQAPPIALKFGERVRIILVNDTMMAHPFHLHGLWSELETGDPDFIPKKHTVIVQPGKKISYLVTADAQGRWAYHCHLMFHMMGMMREVRVSP